MKFLRYLTEKFDFSFKDSEAGLAEIFVNPNRAEFKDILAASQGTNLRYFRQLPVSARGYYNKEKGQLWMWRGDVLHGIVRRKLPAASEFDLVRIEIIPHERMIYIYEPIKDKEERPDLTNVKMIAKKIRSFAPQTRNYTIRYYRGFSQYDFEKQDIKI